MGQGNPNNKPWERDGITVVQDLINTNNDGNIENIYCIDNQITNLQKECANFYLLDMLVHAAFDDTTTILPEERVAISAVMTKGKIEQFFTLFNVKNETERSLLLNLRQKEQSELEKVFAPIIESAELSQKLLIFKLDDLFCEYITMAVGGELRHHSAVRPYLCGSRESSWVAWRDMVNQLGDKAFLYAEELFLEFNEQGYGGKAWAYPSKLLHMRLNNLLAPDSLINAKLFVDRCWSLQHNGGVFFNKLYWDNSDFDKLLEVLNAHANNPPKLNVLLNAAGPEKRALFVDFCMAYEQVFDKKLVSLEPIKATKAAKAPSSKTIPAHLMDSSVNTIGCLKCETPAGFHRPGCKPSKASHEPIVLPGGITDHQGLWLDAASSPWWGESLWLSPDEDYNNLSGWNINPSFNGSVEFVVNWVDTNKGTMSKSMCVPFQEMGTYMHLKKMGPKVKAGTITEVSIQLIRVTCPSGFVYNYSQPLLKSNTVSNIHVASAITAMLNVSIDKPIGVSYWTKT